MRRATRRAAAGAVTTASLALGGTPGAAPTRHQSRVAQRSGGAASRVDSGVVAPRRGRANDDQKATQATMMFASTTGSEWINAPYVIHVSAPTPCTGRSVAGLRQKYGTANSTVASHPIQSAVLDEGVRGGLRA